MKTFIHILASTAIATLLLPVAANASLQYGDANYVGFIDPSNPANATAEAGFINTLRFREIDDVELISGKTYNREDSVLAGSPFVEAVTTNSFKNDNSNTTFVLPNTYQYVLAKYGTAAMVWFFPNGISGEITLPAKFVEYNNNGLSHTSVYNVVTTVVPEPGTIAVWGLLAVAGYFGVKKYQAQG